MKKIVLLLMLLGLGPAFAQSRPSDSRPFEPLAKIKFPPNTVDYSFRNLLEMKKFAVKDKKPILLIVTHQPPNSKYNWMAKATQELLEMVDPDKFHLVYVPSSQREEIWKTADSVRWAANRAYPSLIIMSLNKDELVHHITYKGFLLDKRKAMADFESITGDYNKAVKTIKQPRPPKGVFSLKQLPQAKKLAGKEEKNIAYIHMPAELPESVNWHKVPLEFFHGQVVDKCVVVGLSTPELSTKTSAGVDKIKRSLAKSFPSLVIANPKTDKIYLEVDMFSYETWHEDKMLTEIEAASNEVKRK